MYYDRLSDLGIKLTRRSGQDKVLCPQCSNARKNKRDRCLSVNVTTGEYHCHNCAWTGNVRHFEKRRETKTYDKPDKSILKNIELKDKMVQWFSDQRKISLATLNKFLIFQREEYMPQENKKMECVCFPYFRGEELVNVKYRAAGKRFRMTKDAELIFYNLNSITDKKRCILVEGEIDAMSAYEVGYGKECDKETGEVDIKCEYGVVSVPNGASGNGNANLDYLDNCADWFLGLDEIVIATDGDFAGRNLCSELVRRLGVERCRVLNYPSDCVIVDKENKMRACKDLNEVLINFGKEKVIECVTSAASIPVDGIYFVEDVLESMVSSFKRGVILGESTHFESFDKYFRWKKGDVNLCTGFGNAGKTYWYLQLMLTKSIYDGWKWGVFSPENYPANDFYDDLIEMYCGKWISKMSEDEYREAANFVGEHIYYVYPDNEHDLVTIHEKFRYLILKKGIDGVLIDPWNQLDHNQNKFQREDQFLSECFKDIKRFTLMNHICYSIIAHPKNPTYNADRSLPVADMYDLSGGSMWANKMDNIMSYHRPRYHEDKNSPEAEVWVQKIKRKRTGGEPGHVGLKLIWEKKRFAEMPEGVMPCDPGLIKMLGEQGVKVFNQGWLPYADGGSEIGF